MLFRSPLVSQSRYEDLINIGAYVKGSDPKCDEAIRMMDKINEFLTQKVEDKFNYDETIQQLLNLGK